VVELQRDRKLAPPVTPASVVGPRLFVDTALSAKGYTIVHLKVMDESSAGWVKASIVRNGAEPALQGCLDASPAVVH